MPKAVIEDWEGFLAFLAAQPLCKCAAQRQLEIAAGKHGGTSEGLPPPPKNDNADLMAALSSMA